VIETFSRSNQWEWCSLIFSDWISNSHSLSSSNVVAMVRLLSMNGKAEEATKFVRESLEHYQENIHPKVRERRVRGCS